MDTDSVRLNALEALSSFIKSQRALIARAQNDIERLRELQDEDAPLTLSDIHGDLVSMELSNLAETMKDLPETFDWSVCGGLDPAPFRELANNATQSFTLRNEPSKEQHSELSSLQVLVKTARQAIVDPILAEFALVSEPEELTEDELTPEELRRQEEHAKIRELKKRKVHYGGLTIPFRDAAVYVRRDVEDESADVDISMDNGDIGRTTGSSEVPPLSGSPVITPPTHSAKFVARHRTMVPQPISSEPPRRKSRPTPTKFKKEDKKEEMSSLKIDKISSGSHNKRPDKPKSETYKQAWTDSEQLWLERLLKEIPDGEKNRWLKISKAMDGRRTPRQVASRVQKYNMKLKRFGLSIDNDG